MTCAAPVTHRLAMPIMALAAKNTAREGPGRRTAKLATFLIDLSPADMERRLTDALGVYVDAMRYPRGTEDQRSSMWLEHTRRDGWKAVAAVDVADRRDATSATAADLVAAPIVGGAGPVVATAGRRGVAPGRHRQHPHRRTDDQLFRADGAAHPSPHTGSRPRRGADPQAARGPARIPCAAVHTGDQRRVEPGLAALSQARIH